MFSVNVLFSNGEKFHNDYEDFDTALGVYNELTEFGEYRKAEIREDGEWIDLDEYFEDEAYIENLEWERINNCEECGFDPYCGCYTYDC